jgi:DNA invertase Pin-like site-specific DNA recombinase
MKVVAYYRVSTKRQGQSGLGLEAQKSAVAAYAASIGSRIVAEFTEVETGKRADRPKLAQAIAHTRALRGRLVIAKLDRLARNVAFTATLMDSGVEFVCCDMPYANRLTLHVVAAVAEDESRRVSERTRAALAAAKARGTRLGTRRRGHYIDHAKGTRNGLAKAVTTAATLRLQARQDCYSHLLPDVQSWRDAGDTLATIADKLNEAGHVTTGGKQFAAMTVKRLLEAVA